MCEGFVIRQCSVEERQELDVGIEPRGVLRSDAAAAGARDRRLHTGAEVLQRAGGDPARALRGGVRGDGALAPRRRPRTPRTPHTARTSHTQRRTQVS